MKIFKYMKNKNNNRCEFDFISQINISQKMAKSQLII